jgi:hypothetical protein
MPADLLVLRAARNAFLFVLLALVGVSTYQFATIGSIEPGIAVIWIVGAGGFYASKWYYKRGQDGADGGEVAGDESAATNGGDSGGTNENERGDEGAQDSD